MYNVLVWGAGYGYGKYINALKYQEVLNEIKIIGITAKDALYDYLDGYPFIPLSAICEKEFDYIVVTVEVGFSSVLSDVKNMGYPEKCMIKACVFTLPGFLFSEYVKLICSRVSIISNNCWGGTMYHSLGMKFFSPFINMFETDEDYLKLLSDLKYYMGCKLEYIEYGFDPILDRRYPICKLDDIKLYFNHYIDMDEVEGKWYKRIERINWDNIFIMMYTENQNTVYEFDKLKYEKKICFVPFETSTTSSYHLEITNRIAVKNIPFWNIVNKIAGGYYHDYNLIDLLNNGTATRNRYYL